MDLKRYDIVTWIDKVWEGLQCGFEADLYTEEQWDDMCTAMSWIIEDLGYELNDDGDYVEIQR